jgi:hypothetical membrane protein
MRLEVKALALATGIVFAAFTFVIAVIAVLTGVGLGYLELVGGLHPGYTGPTLLGACIQTFWMFVYGLIGGGLLAAIYNYFSTEKGK